jgi:hypothetical protein
MVKDIKENANTTQCTTKKRFSSDGINVCMQMENTSKVIKFVNHGFHIIKTYNHIPGTFLMLLISPA